MVELVGMGWWQLWVVVLQWWWGQVKGGIGVGASGQC